LYICVQQSTTGAGCEVSVGAGNVPLDVPDGAFVPVLVTRRRLAFVVLAETLADFAGASTLVSAREEL
jgi:hypothetical protein